MLYLTFDLERADGTSVQANEFVESVIKATESINDAYQSEALFYMYSFDYGKMHFGSLFDGDYCDFKDCIQRFAASTDMKLCRDSLKEIILSEAISLIRRSYRKHYIDKDEDAIYESFNIGNMVGKHSGLSYGESIQTTAPKRQLYKALDSLATKRDMLPELDRIYAVSANSSPFGIPVHYLLQVDDREIRKNTYKILISALYQCSRIAMQRYTYIDFNPCNVISCNLLNTIYSSSKGGTVVIRCECESDDDSAFASINYDCIKQVCDIILNYRNSVQTILCMPVESNYKTQFFAYLGNTTFVTIQQDYLEIKAAKKYLSSLAKSERIATDKLLFSKLKNDTNYSAADLKVIFDEWHCRKLKNEVYPQYKDVESLKRIVKAQEAHGVAYDELMGMVGLEQVKNVINTQINYFRAQMLFASNGIKSEKPKLHCAFLGNPGTCKSTVARLYAQILKDNGIITTGQLVECGRAELIAKYVGQTAPLIKARFEQASGGVLFIDEAYSIIGNGNNGFDEEAISTILTEMENRDDVVVVFAGYTDLMQDFINQNPGLKSRIAYTVPFEDYSIDELVGISDSIASKQGLSLSSDAKDKLKYVFASMMNQPNFGNGRAARAAIEKAHMAQASRLLSKDYDRLTKTDITTITAADIEMPQDVFTCKAKIGFCA